MASGIVFFHRFYMFHSFKEFSRWVTAPTCLFLAGKVEETPKKCRDVLKVTQQNLSDNRFKAFGENPREEMMIIERILLQTIKFDLQLTHPYSHLIKFGKLLKGDRDKINELIQKAWIFINDSLSLTICLIYPPQVVALAVLLLSFKLTNQNIREFLPKPRPDWWKIFYSDANEAELEDICEELMNMYNKKPPKRRFPNATSKNQPLDTQQKNSPKPLGSPQAKKVKLSMTTTTLTTVSEITTATSTFSTTCTTKPTTLTTTKTTPISTSTSVVAKNDTTSTTDVTNSQQKDTVNTAITTTATITTSMEHSIKTTTVNVSQQQPFKSASDPVRPPLPPISNTPSTSVTSSTGGNTGISRSMSVPNTAATSNSNQPTPPMIPVTAPIHSHVHPVHPPLPQIQQQKPHHHHSEKQSRHEQLKSFIHNQPPNQHSPIHLGPNTPVRMGVTTAPLPQNTPQQQQHLPSQVSQSPFKPASAPILDHMSSFFQSTPPPQNNLRQPPLPNQQPNITPQQRATTKQQHLQKRQQMSSPIPSHHQQFSQHQQQQKQQQQQQPFAFHTTQSYGSPRQQHGAQHFQQQQIPTFQPQQQQQQQQQQQHMASLPRGNQVVPSPQSNFIGIPPPAQQPFPNAPGNPLTQSVNTNNPGLAVPNAFNNFNQQQQMLLPNRFPQQQPGNFPPPSFY